MRNLALHVLATLLGLIGVCGAAATFGRRVLIVAAGRLRTSGGVPT
jgi:hypothetical protein